MNEKNMKIPMQEFRELSDKSTFVWQDKVFKKIKCHDTEDRGFDGEAEEIGYYDANKTYIPQTPALHRFNPYCKVHPIDLKCVEPS